MSEIKLFVCCNKADQEVPEHPLLYPIQGGAALADSHFPGMLHDDVGDHISQKNRSYCELTAQYWAWKNVDADYYGFFHYRRYLCPDSKERGVYCIRHKPTQRLLSQMGFGNLESLIKGYDVVVPREEKIYQTVYQQYATARYHHEGDLQLALQIVEELYPEYGKAAREYLYGHRVYFGNIYVMKKDIFHEYCQWLFTILKQFDVRANVEHYGVQERRVDGYLAERLFGIYLTHQQNRLRVLKMPGVHFYTGSAYWKKRLITACFPPGSRRKKWIKRITLGESCGK